MYVYNNNNDNNDYNINIVIYIYIHTLCTHMYKPLFVEAAASHTSVFPRWPSRTLRDQHRLDG